jgi:WD40 repeat protein
MPAIRLLAAAALAVTVIVLSQSPSAGQGKPKLKPGAPLVTDPADLPKPGGPLSAMALVQRPPTLKNVRAWSIETRRHRYLVNYMTASSDGKKVATSGSDGLVRLWDPTTGLFERAFVGHEGAVSGLAFSPDNKYLASAGYYNVRVWDVATGMPVRVLKGKYGVSLVAWSPDGTQLLTGGGGSGQIALWDVAANKQLVETEYGNPVGSIAWSPDGEHIAVAASRAGTYIVDTVKLKTDHVFKEMLDTDYAVAFSPDSKLLATGSSKQTVIYEVSSGSVSKKFATPGYVLTWTPKSALLVGNAGYQITPREPGDLKPGKPLPGNGSVLSLAADGNTLFGVYGATVTQWDLEKGTVVRSFPVAEYLTLTCGPSTSVLVPGPPYVLWDAATGKRIGELEDYKGAILASAWGPTGKVLAVAGYDKKVRVYDPATAKLLRTLTTPQPIVALAVAGDGRVAASMGDKKIAIFPATGEQIAHTLEGFSHPIMVMGWTRDGRLLATADDKSIAICSAESGKQVKTIEHPRTAHALLWSTDGGRLYVGSSEDVVLSYYLAASWKLQPALDKGTASLAAVPTGWSPDGQTLLGYRNSAIQQWNGKTGKLGTAVGSYASATSPAFWQDGRTVCTGCIDRSARYWDSTGRFRFTLIADKGEVISVNADGHYRCPEAAEGELVAVVMTDKVQETLTLKEFATKYGFHNVPTNVK